MTEYLFVSCVVYLHYNNLSHRCNSFFTPAFSFCNACWSTFMQNTSQKIYIKKFLQRWGFRIKQKYENCCNISTQNHSMQNQNEEFYTKLVHGLPTENGIAKGVKVHAGFSLWEALANSHNFQRIDHIYRFPIEKKVLNATFKTLRHLQTLTNIRKLLYFQINKKHILCTPINPQLKRISKHIWYFINNKWQHMLKH